MYYEVGRALKYSVHKKHIISNLITFREKNPAHGENNFWFLLNEPKLDYKYTFSSNSECKSLIVARESSILFIGEQKMKIRYMPRFVNREVTTLSQFVQKDLATFSRYEFWHASRNLSPLCLVYKWSDLVYIKWCNY